jgi:hypothetical protein
MAAFPPGRLTETPEVQSGSWFPQTEAERAAVRQQLTRLLASAAFVNSKRCASLLRHVVDCALEGNVQPLKERTLGIEVFQREPDYDTNRDPVVRNTAVEIRKRLAQYYAGREHELEIRIDFPAGSYLPEFRMPSGSLPEPEPLEERTEQPLSVPKKSALRRVHWLGIAAAIVTAVVVSLRLAWFQPTALDHFWAPVLASSEPVLILIGGANRRGDLPDHPPVSIGDLQIDERVHFADSATLSRIAALMGQKRKPFHIRLQRAAILDDLRGGPAISIGAFCNDWTLRLADQGRYGFARDSESHTAWISDRQNPSDRKWSTRTIDPYRTVKEDYALVSRVLDPTTQRLVVTAAGITKFGTAAAGEFLSEPAYMDQAMRSASKGWERKNIQIVLATSLVGESSGPPRVLTTHVW